MRVQLTAFACAAGAVLGAAVLPASVEGPPGPAAQVSPCPLDAFDWDDPTRFRLAGLREVSGLDRIGPDRLLAHDDERGIIVVLDAYTGKTAATFSLGPPLPREDFEGIARLGDRLFLATSSGRVYESHVGTDRQRLPFRVRETGLGDRCELEGLAADSAAGTLLLSCKNPRRRDLRGDVVVFDWNPDLDRAPDTRFRSPASALRPGRGDSFRPSAVEVLPGGDLLLLSGADRVIAAVRPPATVLCSRALPDGHRQAEGLALLPDGSIAIADEGGVGPGRLTRYGRRSR